MGAEGSHIESPSPHAEKTLTALTSSLQTTHTHKHTYHYYHAAPHEHIHHHVIKTTKGSNMKKINYKAMINNAAKSNILILN